MKTKFTKSSLVIKRQLRTRSKLLKLRPRLSVFRSNKAVYAQIIDDLKGHTLVSAKGKTGKEVGLNLAEKAKLKKVKLNNETMKKFVPEIKEKVGAGEIKFCHVDEEFGSAKLDEATVKFKFTLVK